MSDRSQGPAVRNPFRRWHRHKYQFEYVEMVPLSTIDPVIRSPEPLDVSFYDYDGTRRRWWVVEQCRCGGWQYTPIDERHDDTGTA